MAVDTVEPVKQEVVSIFRSSWGLYQKILDGDHLEHRLLYSAVAEDMALRWGGGGVSLLDLGCGDAHYIAATLHSTGLAQHVGRYTGVDLAEPALEVAKENMTAAMKGFPQCTISLIEGNMVTFAGEDTVATQNAALVSFAAHHLPTLADKRSFLASVLHQLKPGGVFYVVDAFRRPGEDRPEYITSFCALAESGWTKLNPEERGHMISHMQDFDFPATEAEYRQLAVEVGFASVDLLACDGTQYLRALALRV